LQCSSEKFDYIKGMIAEIEEAIVIAEEEDEDDTKSALLAKYRVYLERKLKTLKIEERAWFISKELKSKFEGRNHSETPQVFHISAVDYMEWISRSKLPFASQPALSPERTGIPLIREYLFNLPAQRNLNEISSHVEYFVPGYLDKITRIITRDDRNAGFGIVAEAFGPVKDKLLTELLKQAMVLFSKLIDDALGQSVQDPSVYKSYIHTKVTQEWCSFKGLTFTKLLSLRGIMPPLRSKVNGLTNGCNWAQELADLLAPIFKDWEMKFTEHMRIMKPCLSILIDLIHRDVTQMLESSPATVMVTDKTAKLWEVRRTALQMITEDLMTDVERIQSHCVLEATMEDRRPQGTITSITDYIFDDAFSATPPLNPKTKKYVTSKCKHQMKKLEEMFLDPKEHFVDRVMLAFIDKTQQAYNGLLIHHFERIRTALNDFTSRLRALQPINYTVTKDGEDIRQELAKLLPEFHTCSEELKELVPKPTATKHTDDHSAPKIIADNTEANLEAIYCQIRASEKKRKVGNTNGSRNVRVKREP
jgi:hypothetical protein